jgi:hypothetical protein
MVTTPPHGLLVECHPIGLDCRRNHGLHRRRPVEPDTAYVREPAGPEAGQQGLTAQVERVADCGNSAVLHQNAHCSNISEEVPEKMTRASARAPAATEDVVVTRATLRAAARLGLSHKVLARVLGLSEATVSRMGTGSYLLKPGDKSFDLALLFVRLFRSLDAIAGGDEQTTRAWLRNEHLALGGVPVSLIESVGGLVNVVGYLDARRALV